MIAPPNYTIETRWSYDPELIEQITKVDNSAFDRAAEFSRTMIDLQDQGIRKALIALGWTPPVK